MTVWVFILLFAMPSFGGPVAVSVASSTQDGCERLKKVIVRELEDHQMKKFVILQECTAYGP